MYPRFVRLLFVCLSIVVTASSQTELLKHADQLAWRGNWVKAGPLYEDIERSSAEKGDNKNALRARIGYIRSQMQCGSASKLLHEMNHELANPVIDADPELKIRALA